MDQDKNPKKACGDVPVAVYYPTAGVKSDFETLLKHFSETQSVRYEHFLTVWHEMKMSFIFAGRQHDREVREFTEECLKLAKAYWLPPYNFQIRVGGLYLLYGLYFKQPYEPRVKIRITPSNWSEIQNFLAEVQENKHLDVEYIYHRLRYHNAFQFVATDTEMNMLRSCGASIGGIHGTDPEREKQAAIESDHVIQQKSIISEILKPDTIGDLSAIHDQYHRTKCALAGSESTQPDPSLDIVQSTLVQYLTRTVANHEWWRKNKAGKKGGHGGGRKRQDSGPTTSESEGESGSDWSMSTSPKRKKKQSSTIGSSRTEIKSRALSLVGTSAKGRRYRRVLQEQDVEKAILSPPSGSEPNVPENVSSDEMEHTADSEAGSPTKSGLLSMPTFNQLIEQNPKRPKSGKKKKKKLPNESKATPNEQTAETASQPLEKSGLSQMVTSPQTSVLDVEDSGKGGSMDPDVPPGHQQLAAVDQATAGGTKEKKSSKRTKKVSHRSDRDAHNETLDSSLEDARGQMEPQKTGKGKKKGPRKSGSDAKSPSGFVKGHVKVVLTPSKKKGKTKRKT